MYIGVGRPGGMGDIMFRKPNITRDGLKSLEIWTGQKTVAKYIANILQAKLPDSHTVFPKDPKYPVFDDLAGFRSRALFAVALGCDVLPGGIHNFGPSKAFAIKNRIKNWNTDLDQAEDQN